MFIRQKKIKDQHYAYLVKNSWKKAQGTRQKVSKYLGRIIFLDKISDKQFIESLKYPDLYLRKTNPAQMLVDFMKFKLGNFGFAQDKKNNMIMVKDDLAVDLKKCKVLHKNKPIVLAIDKDYLCNYTLRNLMRFKTDLDFDGAGLKLAKAFVATGIVVEEEFFVHLFKKIFNPDGQSYVY